MGTIRENINYIISAQKDLGYHMPSIINPPATEKEIRIVEEKIGLKFNAALIELFGTVNGIQLDGKTPSGLTGIIPIYDLLSLNDAIDYYNEMNWDDHKDIYEIEYELGHQLFPFIHDGAGNCYWVDLNEGTDNYGKLYWTNTFGDRPDYLFNSLEFFFEAIKRGYERGIFSLDEEGYLNCQYKGWGVICHELDKSIAYWGKYVS